MLTVDPFKNLSRNEKKNRSATRCGTPLYAASRSSAVGSS